MALWTVTALDVGTLEFEKSIGTYLQNCGVIARIHNVIFLLKEAGGPRAVVVDTGFESAERTLAVHGQRVWRSPDQEPSRALEAMNVDPSKVETVVLTHLHYDHCGNNGLFPNARFVVQRRELQYAFAPLPGEETAYFSPLIGEKPSFWGTQFDVVEGDCRVTGGIRVLSAPGHTPGSQMVLVDTEGGVYCLAGDNAFYYENVERNVPVGHLYSRGDWFTSMQRAKQNADRILPSHDPLLFRKRPALFP